MGTMVDGKVGDIFYCYEPEHRGWRMVADDAGHTIAVDPNKLDPADIDVDDRATLSNWENYDPVPENGTGDVFDDLQRYVGSHSGTGKDGYYTQEDIAAIADGTFDHDVPPYVQEQARVLLKSGYFNDVAGPNGRFHAYDFDRLGSQKSFSEPYGNSSAPDLKTLLADNGDHASWADIDNIAKTGTYKGMRVPDPVRDEAQDLIDHPEKFNKVAGPDGNVASWDLDDSSGANDDPESQAGPHSDPESQAGPHHDPDHNNGANHDPDHNAGSNTQSPAPANTGPNAKTDGPKSNEVTINTKEDAARTMTELWPDDPTNGMINYVKDRAGVDREYITPRDVQKALDLETGTDELSKKRRALLEWLKTNHGAIDDTAAGTRNAHDNDNQIGAADLQRYLGWNSAKPGKNPDGNTQSPKPADPQNVKMSDITKIYSNGAPLDAMFDDIKSRAGVTGSYITKGDLARVLATTTDEGKKELFQWLNDHFDAFDDTAAGTRNAHDDDGLVGIEDAEKYFGWR
jgi:hypothetical protein